MENCSEHFIPILEPNVALNDIYGPGTYKSELQRFVNCFFKSSFGCPDLFPLGHGRNAQILLCGPSTMDMFHIAIAIAKEVNAPFHAR